MIPNVLRIRRGEPWTVILRKVLIWLALIAVTGGGAVELTREAEAASGNFTIPHDHSSLAKGGPLGNIQADSITVNNLIDASTIQAANVTVSSALDADSASIATTLTAGDVYANSVSIGPQGCTVPSGGGGGGEAFTITVKKRGFASGFWKGDDSDPQDPIPDEGDLTPRTLYGFEIIEVSELGFGSDELILRIDTSAVDHGKTGIFATLDVELSDSSVVRLDAADASYLPPSVNGFPEWHWAAPHFACDATGNCWDDGSDMAQYSLVFDADGGGGGGGDCAAALTSSGDLYVGGDATIVGDLTVNTVNGAPYPPAVPGLVVGCSWDASGNADSWCTGSISNPSNGNYTWTHGQGTAELVCVCSAYIDGGSVERRTCSIDTITSTVVDLRIFEDATSTAATAGQIMCLVPGGP